MMWLSTVWVCLSIVLISDGRLTSAVVALMIWVAHRRLIEKRGVRLEQAKTLGTKPDDDPVP